MTIEIDADYVSCDDADDILIMMSNGNLDLDDLLDRAERTGWVMPEPDELTVDAIIKWISDDDATDAELRAVADSVLAELMSRLESVRELGDAYLAQTRQANERVRELEAVRAIG